MVIWQMPEKAIGPVWMRVVSNQGNSVIGFEPKPWTSCTLALVCLVTLLLTCYGGVLLGGRQFGFRDTARFYYPLYHRVQQEWAAGRLPLWEPEENGGATLLGSPMAAVLYPGKIVFALVPYAWGMRLYVVAHEVLAFAAMLALTRSCGVSRTGAVIGGLCYAFGGTVLSNSFNVIYLVGAAWAPLGFRAADRWLRCGRRWGLIELTLVMVMQVLGGDPEAAYVTALCAFGYAVGLAGPRQALPRRPWHWALGIAFTLFGWAWVGPSVAPWVQGREGKSSQAILAAAWALLVMGFVASRQRDDRRRLGTMLVGLVGSCFLAIIVAAAQVLPAIDLIAASVRWAGANSIQHFDSSVVPYRVVECFWPNFFGTYTTGNHYWMFLLPPIGLARPSPLSLYFGVLPLVLACGAAGFRNGPPQRAWMTVVALVSFCASLGAFAGPSAWSQGASGDSVGNDSLYGLLLTILPGLRLFRFPFKLLVFTSLALAVLAGMGWDRLASGVGRRRVVAGTTVLLMVTGLFWSIAWTQHDRLVAALAAAHPPSNPVFGPLDAPRAVDEMIRAVGQGTLVLLASLAIVVWSRRRPAWAWFALLPLVVADLTSANAGLVITVPQEDFDRVPAVLQAIEKAESDHHTPGPFRVHRLPSWVPTGWSEVASPRRLQDLLAWEIDTLQPRFGLLHGVNVLLADDSQTAREDFWRLFLPSSREVEDSSAAALGVAPGQRILYYPRSTFDLWGAQYFILPSYAAGWSAPNRSYAAFLVQTELIYPDPAAMEGPDARKDRERWGTWRDVQVRRNMASFPRAWVVHSARLIRPLDGSNSAAANALLARLRSPVEDLKALAHIETDHSELLAGYLPGTLPDPSESVIVRYPSSSQVVLTLRLQRPGIVILAETYDPGWRLAIDGEPAPIFRANLLMRAAAVASGSHTLVYTYQPSSVRVGAALSLSGLLVLTGLALGVYRWPASKSIPRGQDSKNPPAIERPTGGR
jgi:hypothetical protein